MISTHRRNARAAARRKALGVSLHVEQLEDRATPTLLGSQLFPSENPWNQKITAAPDAANSAAVMSNVIGQAGDGRIHPDFGQDFGDGRDLFGVPYNAVHGKTTP